MVYEFDFEIKDDYNFVLEEYSCIHNIEVYRKDFELDGYIFLELYNNKVISSLFSKIDNEDIIVMDWKDKGITPLRI